MCGAIPLLPQYAFMVLCSVNALGQLYLYLLKCTICVASNNMWMSWKERERKPSWPILRFTGSRTYLETLRKASKTLGQHIRCSSRDWNPELSEYEGWAFITRQRRSVKKTWGWHSVETRTELGVMVSSPAVRWTLLRARIQNTVCVTKVFLYLWLLTYLWGLSLIPDINSLRVAVSFVSKASCSPRAAA